MQLAGLGFSCNCDRCINERECETALELSTPVGEIAIGQARSLSKSGELEASLKILTDLRSSCSDMPSSFGIRQTTLDTLKLLYFCYQEAKQFSKAYDVGLQIVAMHKPFRLRSDEYLTWAVKVDPRKFLQECDITLEHEWLAELREASSITNGGGSNIFGEIYRLDLGTRGF